MTDRQKKGLIIFNPEDGTMHDGVYRPWINQPKKEKKMTREEASVTIARYNDWDYRETTIEGANGIQVRVNHYKRDLERAFEVLQEPPTLAEFLGWEEGQEYEEEYGDRFIIEYNTLYKTYDANLDYQCKCKSERIFGGDWSTRNIECLRQAKKVETPKLKA